MKKIIKLNLVVVKILIRHASTAYIEFVEKYLNSQHFGLERWRS